AGTFTVTNTLAVGNTIKDIDVVGGTQSYNISSDASAAGTGSLTGRAASAQFVKLTAGSEDLHLKGGSAAVDTGADPAPSLAPDADGDGRPGVSAAWDIGADEKTTTSYRSIGMNAGTIYGTGNASVTAGSTTVTFAGGASLPTNIGTGDVLTFTGAPTE